MYWNVRPRSEMQCNVRSFVVFFRSLIRTSGRICQRRVLRRRGKLSTTWNFHTQPASQPAHSAKHAFVRLAPPSFYALLLHAERRARARVGATLSLSAVVARRARVLATRCAGCHALCVCFGAQCARLHWSVRLCTYSRFCVWLLPSAAPSRWPYVIRECLCVCSRS